ncbi:2-dehydro-3-deoxygluconokinase [Streptomyces sp. Amel2xB2]|uniref:sugar kinase n=1 Tax=Streptomyces sp. Amel2xB2 TaxID=1305829 RepID=UPI000DBAA37C|nr:2-dehydro-3-deoxygluconokinase [Streptomyces sp. Amel2xB2]
MRTVARTDAPADAPAGARADGTDDADDSADVVCLGESMVTFLPSRAGRLADVPSFARAIGGAESNVACALAGWGHSVRWVSRVGADGFGDHLVETIAAQGVDVSRVGRDPQRPTGIYFRTDGERPTTLDGSGAGSASDSASGPGPGAGSGAGTAEVVYYRAGSAASAMSPRSVDLAAVDDAEILHLTGITAALSPECLELMRVLTGPRAGRPLVSFDVNYRVGLWDRAREGSPRVLLDLARGCALVFAGEDEAAAAWGVTGGPYALRELLPEPAVLVVKQGAQGATAFVREDADAVSGTDGPQVAGGTGGLGSPARETVHSVPALRVEVAGAVGAGDGFAAGFLSATLRGLPVRERLRHGHLTAAAALTVPGDLAEPPPRDLADRLAALDAGEWGRLRLGPGWNTQKANAT